MKAFQFTIEPVLTLRARQEHAAAEKHARAAEAQALAERDLAEADVVLEAYHHTLEKQRRESFRPDEHQLYLNALDRQKAFCKRLAGYVAKAAAIAAKEFATLLEARKQHEIVKHLKQHKKAAHQRACVAEEEAIIRDLILARHGRTSR